MPFFVLSAQYGAVHFSHAFFCFTALRTPPKRARGFKRENHFEHAVLKAAVSAVFFHGFGKEANFFKLVAGYIARRSFDKRRQTVYNGGAGMLNGGGLYNVIFNVGFAGEPPVAHIAVVRAVDLADRLFLHRDALHRLDGHDGGHADASAGLDGLAQRGGLDIVVDDAGHVLLRDGLDGQAQLVADGLGGVPGVGRLKDLGMRDLLLELLRGQIAAVRLGQRQAVLVHVVAVRALDLGQLVHAACDEAHDVDPEDVLHAAAGDGAARLLGQRVQLVDLGRGGRPGIDGLLAGGDDVDAARNALFNVGVDVVDEAEQRHDGDVRVALVEHLVRVVGDDHAGLHAQLRIVAHVHADDRGIDVNRAHDLRAVLMQIAQDVLGHLAAAVLHNLDLVHGKRPPCDLFGKVSINPHPRRESRHIFPEGNGHLQAQKHAAVRLVEDVELCHHFT